MRRDGEEIAIDHSAAPIRDRNGQITGVVLVFRDVSRERQYAAKLSYQASHDALTGLINRREFEHRLRRALASAAEFERHHAVMYLDLDQFKVVNDTCGHAAGDELMRQISAVLQRRLREGDTLARLGGDEFGVLLENCPAEHAARIAEELRQTVADFPFAWHSRSFSLEREHRRGQCRERPVHARGGPERRRRGLLHGQGEGPQPRAGLPPRGQRAVHAPGRDGMGGTHPQGARRGAAVPVSRRRSSPRRKARERGSALSSC